MKKTVFILFLACWSLASCVSLKQYRKVVEDLQKCGEAERSYEQWKRIEECEKADRERLKKEAKDE